MAFPRLTMEKVADQLGWNDMVLILAVLKLLRSEPATDQPCPFRIASPSLRISWVDLPARERPKRTFSYCSSHVNHYAEFSVIPAGSTPSPVRSSNIRHAQTVGLAALHC